MVNMQASKQHHLASKTQTPTHCVLFMLCCIPESKSEKAEEDQPSLDGASVCEGRDSRVSERVGEGEGEAAHIPPKIGLRRRWCGPNAHINTFMHIFTSVHWKAQGGKPPAQNMQTSETFTYFQGLGETFQ